MNMNNKSADKLFDEIRSVIPDVYSDGIVDEEEYFSSEYKILYILKELNAPKGWQEKDLRPFLRTTTRPQTWRNIARWTEGIMNIRENFPWEELKDYDGERQKKYIRKIAAINIKKTPGKHTSSGSEIYNATDLFSDIIQKQAEEYSPDIIISCGTTYALSRLNYLSRNDVIPWQQTHNGIDYYIEDGRIFISFTHPEARIGDNFLYYTLMDAVREIFIKKEQKE